MINISLFIIGCAIIAFVLGMIFEYLLVHGKIIKSLCQHYDVKFVTIRDTNFYPPYHGSPAPYVKVMYCNDCGCIMGCNVVDDSFGARQSSDNELNQFVKVTGFDYHKNSILLSYDYLYKD